jgi:CheY-like chemotaxis protein
VGNSASVLVIESNRDIRDFISLALTDEGYNISAAPDIDAALDLLPRISPDVILMDLFAPKGCDPAFINAYHRLPGPHAPVILLTTQSQPELLAEDIHADGFLSKPFHLNDLLDLIAHYICPHTRNVIRV